MWIDETGRGHTVALPDPTEVMSDRFRSSFDGVIGTRGEAVVELLEVLQEEIFDQMLSLPVDAEFEQVAPPLGLLDQDVWSVEELGQYLRSVDLRWRLDAVLALDDYLD
ncbi:MAG: hypothetical protein CMH83_22800 [Nocardioides sp.]|nr:hypothetical protein [Nocardioides sp.]